MSIPGRENSLGIKMELWINTVILDTVKYLQDKDSDKKRE